MKKDYQERDKCRYRGPKRVLRRVSSKEGGVR